MAITCCLADVESAQAYWIGGWGKRGWLACISQSLKSENQKAKSGKCKYGAEIM